MRGIIFAELLAAVGVLQAAGSAPVRLNNLVTELLRLESMPVSATGSIPFRNPRDGWVYFSLRADAREGEKVELALDRQGTTQKLMEITSKQGPAAETMRLLPARLRESIVRSTSGRVAGEDSSPTQGCRMIRI